MSPLFNKAEKANTTISLVQYLWVGCGILITWLTGHYAYVSPMVAVIGKPLAVLVGIGILFFAATCTIIFFQKIFGSKNVQQHSQTNINNKNNNSLKNFITDEDIELLADGGYNKEKKIFYFKNYKIGTFTLDENFAKNHQKYSTKSLHKVPRTAKTVTISFQRVHENVRQTSDLNNDYKLRFFIKRGNTKDSVDERSYRFILHINKHLEQHRESTFGGKYDVLQFQFCVEVGDNSILDTSQRILKQGLLSRKAENLTLLVESFGF